MQQTSLGVVSVVIYFARGVLDAPTVAVGNGKDLLVDS